ncbi:transcriptional repressor [Salinisphaera sp. USBA-960]|uniref:Fur family transcriptional regulator n=1 Tax=Salinisphaera orenii TaxID=856731 RepID=UPI000DBE1EB8|nr:transcriptional repressor [Salifodinibacter halophilus]NNC27032.1 transcriptional repressor [Salifodinibacter halophilus]
MSEAVARAVRICEQQNLKLTATRRRILELVWQNHQPAKAYDLLDQLRAENERAAPPTVYRALEFLKQAGLVHHLESIDAFIGCEPDNCCGRPQFLICRSCHCVAEMHSERLHADATREARTLGFHAENEIIELHGLCNACANSEAGD